MKVLLTTSALSQTALFDAALREGVTRILDIRGRGDTPPVLAGITHRAPRLTAPIIHREIVDAADSTVLLVMMGGADLEQVQSTIRELRPDAEIAILIGVLHAV